MQIGDVKNHKILFQRITSNRPYSKMSNNNEINIKQILCDYPVLQERFSNEDQALIKTLLQEVDESSYALTDWLDALALLYRWLDQSRLTLKIKDGLGYVSCAVKSVGDSSMLTHLPSLVGDFLEQYGCDCAVKK